MVFVPDSRDFYITEGGTLEQYHPFASSKLSPLDLLQMIW